MDYVIHYLDKKYQLYSDKIIKVVEDYRDYSAKYDLLDTQVYLNTLDKLNKLSIDQDRKD